MENKNTQDLLKEQAESLLKDKITQHNSGKCDCAEHNPCYASMWLRGAITNKQVIEDMNNDKQEQLARWHEIILLEKTLYAKRILSQQAN